MVQPALGDFSIKSLPNMIISYNSCYYRLDRRLLESIEVLPDYAPATLLIKFCEGIFINVLLLMLSVLPDFEFSLLLLEMTLISALGCEC